MSIDQSYLSSPKYGYSLNVAVTQQSINSTMKAYLSGLTQPLVTICYIADELGNPQQIQFEELLLLADGADPFTISPEANPTTDPGLIKLAAARFMVGFQARIGLPPKYSPSEVPDIVTFSLSTSSVTFKLMCAEFTVVNYTPAGGYSPARWLSVSQGDTDAWLFESVVDLEQVAVGSDKYYLLPPDVQNSIANFHAGTFGVQQLLFNLDNAALQTVPQIRGVEAGSVLYNVLTQYFIGAYFTQLQIDGQPVLGCTVTRIEPDRSSLNVTDVRMQVGPWVDSLGQIISNPTDEQKRFSSLNYLCMINNESPLPPVPFGWNWVTKEDAADGVLALNRNAFARYLKDQMYYAIQRCCYKPNVRVWQEWSWSEFDWLVWYQWSLTPYQTPTVTYPQNGAKVIESRYSASASDRAGAGGSLGSMELSPSFDVDVTFTGNQIVVVQYLKVYCYISVLASSGSGNVIDIKLTNTFTLGVDASGRLTSTRTTQREDKSELPGQNDFLNFFADLNSLVDNVRNWAEGLADATFQDLPLAVVQSLIFPGGNTFVFKDVVFSNYQDLVSRVSYADPATNLHLTKSRHSTPQSLRARIALKDLPPEIRKPVLIEATTR